MSINNKNRTSNINDSLFIIEKRKLYLILSRKKY